VYGALIDYLFPEGTPVRIPIAAITGTSGKTTTGRMLARILMAAGYTVGVAATDGVLVDGVRIRDGDCAGPRSARDLLAHPRIDAAVLETARGGILKYGLGFDWCNVAAVLNVRSDHLGFEGIGTIEQLAAVKQLVVSLARDCAVLNADDPLCLAMQGAVSAREVILVSASGENGAADAHLAAGGRAALLSRDPGGGRLVLARADECMPLIDAQEIPATLGGLAPYNAENALFAAAMAWGMGIQPDVIRRALATFECSYAQLPGRTNIYRGRACPVILDFGHNPDKIGAVSALAARWPVTGRRICVLSAPGNRRDEDILEVARRAAPCFRQFICYSRDELRGRTPGEVPRLLSEGLLDAGVRQTDIRRIPQRAEAVEAALQSAAAGDLLVIFGRETAAIWRQITAT